MKQPAQNSKRTALTAVIVRWLALLLILPLAAAGTADEPELSDPAGDAAVGRGDILTAWVAQVDSTHVDLHVTLASLGSDDSIALYVTWQIVGPFGGTEATHGARIMLLPTGDSANQMRPALDGSGLENGEDLSLSVQRGSPASIIVSEVPTGGIGWGGGTMSGFSAEAVISTPVSNLVSSFVSQQHDEAGPQGEFTLGLGGASADAPWPILGEPVLSQTADEETLDLLNIESVWFAPNGTGYDLTLQVPSLTYDQVSECGSLAYSFSTNSYGRDSSIRATTNIHLLNGWVEKNTDFVKLVYPGSSGNYAEVSTPHAVRWVLGTPGYIQFKATDVDFDDWDAQIQATAICGELRETLAQTYDFDAGDALRAIILPTFFAIVASVIATRYHKKHRRQR